jgi:two-component system, chemotaxis family, protein-glutamate methylesterase/glutaminase
MSRIRLAIVDDSTFMRKALGRVLENEANITIAGSAASGEELLADINKWNPDVITLDLSMPGMGGLRTLEKIMEWKRVPVIILSTHSTKETQLTIEALHSGAVDFIDKQRYSLVDFDSLRKVLVEKIFQLTKKETISRKHERLPSETGTVLKNIAQPVQSTGASGVRKSYDALFIVASTGGPPAIQKILEDIGTYLSVPVAIVQHMPEGFIKPFASRLNAHMPFPVREAPHAEIFQNGSVCIGPTGYHLRLKQEDGKIYTVLTRYPENSTHRPSGDVLFQTAAPIYGCRAIAVLLTGMGKDGALGMAEMATAGAYTIAQDEASSIVYGMPKAAVDLGAVREVLHINRIGKRIIELLNNNQYSVGAKIETSGYSQS